MLTTFHLTMGDGGLHTTLENTVAQLSERSDMRIYLDYRLTDLSLATSEEAHLLQIAHEAGKNTIHHSKGDKVFISLQQNKDKSVTLLIDDDGVGVPDTPEKLNHYGLAIMNDRSRNLGGAIKFNSEKKVVLV